MSLFYVSLLWKLTLNKIPDLLKKTAFLTMDTGLPEKYYTNTCECDQCVDDDGHIHMFAESTTKKGITYYDCVLGCLSESPHALSLDELMMKMLFPHPSLKEYTVIRRTKMYAVIKALKKGIKLHTITKIENPNVKTLYQGHRYQIRAMLFRE